MYSRTSIIHTSFTRTSINFDFHGPDQPDLDYPDFDFSDLDFPDLFLWKVH